MRRPARTTRATLAVGAAVLALVLSACTLPSTQSSQTFVKPPEPPDIEPFINAATKATTTPWAASYKINGTDITSQLDLVFGGNKAKVATTLGGITIELFATLSPVTVSLCVQTTGIDIGCFDVSSLLEQQQSGAGSGDAATPASQSTDDSSDTGGSSTLDTLTSLVNVPGTKLVEEMLVPPGAEALCLVSPATAISNEIKVCLADSGGFLFYTNQKLTISALSFTHSVDPANLDPPPPSAGLAGLL